ncbi:hypothetical protein AC578_9443 [Pseudocercospora eumusae]|uniref:Uncharacterized protein n=1 Tax=Pseudocercospora eumusae TaxID=321146 RepID=A0A139H2R4_9PEZI|nr:hypothetical protein AC578_9443 [Pseudocercospora eumusae]
MSVGWHALATDDLDLTSQPALVEMLDVDGTTGECCEKVNLSVVEQVVALSLETWVWLLLDLELNVARLYTRHLVTLAPEVDFGAALHTTVDVHVQNLAFDDSLLAVALLALVLLSDGLTLTIAVRADGLESLDHGTHLAHHGLHSLSITSCTCLDSALLTTAALAF